ncbi:hypothetical protein Nepgr_033586 [Nepenthes gracilis]|uniref:Uncharacterized protein n=1 Tax=Nepenthes gracilis TaxID=150966 RepID=A0AAD3TMT7_NEPGR|nr:hypothetical protein Nepgr_033586 [Nepenthes gracilis]
MAGLLGASPVPPQSSASPALPASSSSSFIVATLGCPSPQESRLALITARPSFVAPFLEHSKPQVLRKTSVAAPALIPRSEVIRKNYEGLDPELSFYPPQSAGDAMAILSPPIDVIDKVDLPKPPSPGGPPIPVEEPQFDECPLKSPGFLQNSNSDHSLSVASAVTHWGEIALPSGALTSPCHEPLFDHGPAAAEPDSHGQMDFLSCVPCSITR